MFDLIYFFGLIIEYLTPACAAKWNMYLNLLLTNVGTYIQNDDEIDGWSRTQELLFYLVQSYRISIEACTIL